MLKTISLSAIFFVFSSPVFYSFFTSSAILVTIENSRAICETEGFPEDGWKLISKSEDNGTNGIMGRTTCIFVDEINDPALNTVYVGTENSGLWKCSNFNEAMPQWICLTENARLPGIGVVDIEVDPKNADNIYIATAIGVSFEWSYGIGILNSNNGGKTWNESSLSEGEPNLANCIAQRIKLVKNRRNGKNHLVALANKSIYKSNNGGIDFSLMASLTDFEGGNSNYFFNDLLLTENDSQTLFASSVDQFLENGGARLMASENDGSSWKDLSFLLNKNYSESTQKTDLTRIDIAVSPSKPNVLYVFGVTKTSKRVVYTIENPTKENAEVKAYILNDGLGSFWMSDIEVSRLNPNRIYLGRIYSHYINLPKNENEPVKTGILGNSTTIHSDKRDHYIIGNLSEEKLYCANDGGVAVYEKQKNGEYLWINKTGKGLAITQFYGLGVSNQKNWVAAGAQDLGGFLFGEQEKNYRCGDGYQAEIDAKNERIYIGYNDKVSNYPTSSFCGKVAIPIGRNDIKFEVNHDGILVAAGFATGQGGDQFLENGKRGNFIFFYDPATDAYSEISAYPYSMANPIISKSDYEGGMQRTSALALAANAKVLYLAGNRKEANRNRLWRLDYANPNDVLWQNLTEDLNFGESLLPRQLWQSISCISVFYNNQNSIWIGFADNLESGRHKVAYHPNVLDKSSAAMWVYLDKGLPNFPVNFLEEDPKTGFLYAATDVGVYVNKQPSLGNSVWECFNFKLPVVKVTDIEIETDSREIFISTYGRGLWKAKLLEK